MFIKLDFDQQNLTPDEVDYLDSCFESIYLRLLILKGRHFCHIAGYVAFKETSSSTTLNETAIALQGDSDFRRMVSRGKLSYPSETLYDLTLFPMLKRFCAQIL